MTDLMLHEDQTDLMECDGCAYPTAEWVSCQHGQSRCPECGLCHHCRTEAKRP